MTLRRHHLVLLIGAVVFAAGCASSADMTSADHAGGSPPLMSAAVAPQAAAPVRMTPIFETNQLRAHMAFLADDALEGREAGTRGYDLAARYVASNFERLGLEAAGDSGSYLQEVTFQETSLTADAVSMKFGEHELTLGEDFVVFADPLREESSVSGPAIFVGFGLDAPSFGLNDYEGVDVNGKIAVVLYGGMTDLPSEERSYITSRSTVMRTAAEKGATAVLFISSLDFENRFPFTRLARFVGRRSTTWVDPNGNASASTSGLKAAGWLSHAAAARLLEGSGTDLESLLQESEAAAPSALELNVPVEIRTTSTRKRFTSPNVAALLRGSDTRLNNEVVVLSAHLDHEGIGRPVAGDSIYNGALDNSAGISVLIEVARAFSDSGTRPRRSILFLAVTAEEKGLLGSEYYAAHPSVGDMRLVANVNLDMPLLLYDFTDVVAFGADRSSIGKTVARAAARLGLQLSPDPMPEQGIFTRSDHYSFVKRGVPAVFLVTGFANGGDVAFQNFFENHYHRPSDQMDLPIDYQAAAKFALVNWMIAEDLANDPATPSWNEGDFFGERFGGGTR